MLNVKFAVVLLATLSFMPLSPAQMRAGASSHRGVSITFSGQAGRPRGERSAIVLGDPYFYSDYASEPAAMEAPPPQVVVLQMPAQADEPKEAKPGPLMIELQGDRYVRVSDGIAQPGARARSDYTEIASAKPAVATKQNSHSQAPVPLAPVVLVYRDGHHEEIGDYTIADGVIYARGDYWTDGYWTKKIQLSALNLPATEKTSQEHGAKFVLPRSVNEVVTRP